ncbi:CCHC-type domain-containing protein, partial [Aphis craccivora]
MTDQWKTLSERRQGENEHIADYFYDKLRLYQALQLNYNETRDHVVMGIRSQELTQRLYELRRTQFQTTVEPRVVPIGKTAKYDQRNANNHRAADKMPSKSTTLSVGPTTTSVIPRASTVRCFNCNMNGDIGRDCPSPRKPCSICQSTALTRERCPEKPTEAMRIGTSPLVPRQNNFVKNVRLNEFLTTCLIDIEIIEANICASEKDSKGAFTATSCVVSCWSNRILIGLLTF